MHRRLIISTLAGLATIIIFTVLLTGCSLFPQRNVPAATQPAATTPSAASEQAVAPTPAARFSAHPTLGDILTDDAGMTLYAFASDRAGVSVCADTCAISWPPLTVADDYTVPAEEQAEYSVITRADGDRQLVFHLLPLYYYALDELPGDAKGNGAKGLWFVVTPTLNHERLTLEASSTPASASSSPIATSSTAAVKETKPVVFTMDDVVGHSSASDCWFVIDRKVYDVTRFIATHPGGQAIVEGCGRDATSLFETRPMGSGTAHSDRARSLLADYLIGDLL